MTTLRGKLPSLSLADVLQMLHGNRNTGLLTVTRDGRRGVFYLQQGQMIQAETADAQGESAACDILGWDRGEFEFHNAPVTLPVTITRSVPDLLIEMARTLDSRAHLALLFPDLERVPWPTLSGSQLTQGVRIPEEDLVALAFLDGYHTFNEIIASSGLSDVSVLQTCSILQGAGRLELLDPARTVAVAAVKPAFLAKGFQGRMGLANEAHWQAMLGPWGKKHQPCRLAKAHEEHWQALGGPYGAKPLEQVRVLLPAGPRLVPVQFVKGLPEETVEVPKELMEDWKVGEGAQVRIRPAEAGPHRD